MVRYMWVDKKRVGRGAVVFGLGLVLLLTTPWLGSGTSSIPECSSMNDPERARECVSSSAQAMDRGGLIFVGLVLVAVATATVGGVFVVRARHRVMDLAEAAIVMETDVPGVRSLVAQGSLVSFTDRGRTYVEAAMVETRLRAGAEPGAVVNR